MEMRKRFAGHILVNFVTKMANLLMQTDYIVHYVLKRSKDWEIMAIFRKFPTLHQRHLRAI